MDGGAKARLMLTLTDDGLASSVEMRLTSFELDLTRKNEAYGQNSRALGVEG